MEKEYRILSFNANKLFENSKGYKIDNTNNKLSKDYKSVIDNKDKCRRADEIIEREEIYKLLKKTLPLIK